MLFEYNLAHYIVQHNLVIKRKVCVYVFRKMQNIANLVFILCLHHLEVKGGAGISNILPVKKKRSMNILRSHRSFSRA